MDATNLGGRRQRGWSLVEMAVVLVVLALVGAVALRLADIGGTVARGQDRDVRLADAEAAVLGFYLAHQRLPAADTGTPDGVENAGAQSGWLPTRTLGLPQDMRLRYSVSALLTAAPDPTSFAPMLPNAPADLDAHAGALNGLDACLALKALQTGAPTATLGGVAIAYAITDTGGAGDDYSPTATAALPGTAASTGLRTIAVGPGELAARVSCPDRVVRTAAAARSAYAAHDMEAFAELFRDIRQVAKESSETSGDMAAVAVAMAALNFVIATYSGISDAYTMAAGWPPAIGAPVAAVALAATTGALATATYDVTAAALEVEEAYAQEQDAADQLAAAEAYLVEAKARARAAYARASELDSAGLEP